MNPTRPCHFNVGDEVIPLNPEYMRDCIGTVRAINFRQDTKDSDHWVWKVWIKLHKPFITKGMRKKIIDQIIRQDTELQKVPTRIGEIILISCQ